MRCSHVTEGNDSNIFYLLLVAIYLNQKSIFKEIEHPEASGSLYFYLIATNGEFKNDLAFCISCRVEFGAVIVTNFLK